MMYHSLHSQNPTERLLAVQIKAFHFQNSPASIFSSSTENSNGQIKGLFSAENISLTVFYYQEVHSRFLPLKVIIIQEILGSFH